MDVNSIIDGFFVNSENTRLVVAVLLLMFPVLCLDFGRVLLVLI